MNISKIVVVGLVLVVMLGTFTSIVSLGSGNTTRASSSFSPQEVWTYQGKELNSTTGEWTTVIYPDINGDNKAEIELVIKNYSANILGVELLNGANGNVLVGNEFTDAGYVNSGDSVIITPTVYGEIIEDSSGTPASWYDWVIFENHSDNHRISIYKIDNTTLSNITYRGIDIPTTLNYGSVSGSVDMDVSQAVFHPLSWGNDAYLLYMGYYFAPVYSGYGIEEIQIIMMDKNLNTIWEKTEKVIGSSDFPMIGADITSLNGWGLNSLDSDILFVNLTASSGNTTITAIDSLTGNIIWTQTVSGVFMVSSPIAWLNSFNVIQFDYNNDEHVDFAIETINTNNNETQLYFIQSDGTILGYYTLGIQKLTLFSLFTDYKTPQPHTLYNDIDVNGDGNGELFFINNNTELVCWDVANNNSVWNLPLVNQSYYYGVYLSTNDVNGDGVWDIYLVGMNETDGGEKVNFTAIDSAHGNILWNKIYPHLVGGVSGTMILKEISDIDGDGLQDALIVDGYYNDGNAVYVNVTAISMMDGSAIWTKKVSSGLNNNDYENWTTLVAFTGDINGDGTNDVMVEMIYYSTTNDWSYIRILSGTDGTLLWTGNVEEDVKSTEVNSFAFYPIETGWNQFDYNDDGTVNEILITTGYSVQVYAVVGTIPEFNFGVIVFLIPIAFIASRLYTRKH